MADVEVHAIAKQGYAAAVRANQSIGAQGAEGSCIAVAWIHSDDRHFAAHVDFNTVQVTAQQCTTLWDTLNVTKNGIKSIGWSASSPMQCTNRMLAVMKTRFEGKIKLQGKMGSVYLTEGGAYAELKQNSILKVIGGGPESTTWAASV